jgi:hypothetical protein
MSLPAETLFKAYAVCVKDCQVPAHVCLSRFAARRRHHELRKQGKNAYIAIYPLEFGGLGAFLDNLVGPAPKKLATSGLRIVRDFVLVPLQRHLSNARR